MLSLACQPPPSEGTEADQKRNMKTQDQIHAERTARDVFEVYPTSAWSQLRRARDQFRSGTIRKDQVEGMICLWIKKEEHRAIIRNWFNEREDLKHVQPLIDQIESLVKSPSPGEFDEVVQRNEPAKGNPYRSWE